MVLAKYRLGPGASHDCQWRIRRVTLTVAERTIERDTRHSALQDRILAAFGVEAASWAPAVAG